MVRRRRLVSPTDRVTGGNKNPRGFSPRSVINERALESLESLPVRCRFDFHDGSWLSDAENPAKISRKSIRCVRTVPGEQLPREEAGSRPRNIIANYIFLRILITNKSDVRVAVMSALSIRHVES